MHRTVAAAGQAEFPIRVSIKVDSWILLAHPWSPGCDDDVMMQEKATTNFKTMSAGGLKLAETHPQENACAMVDAKLSIYTMSA